MSDDEPKSLVIRAAPEKRVDTRPREGGMLVARMERLRNKLEAMLLEDVKEHNLRRYAFLDDEELNAARVNGKPLTNREKRIARSFEMSKKEAPVSLQFAHDRLINAQRGQQEQKSLQINVERAIIRVPDTKQDVYEDAVVIDVDPHATR